MFKQFCVFYDYSDSKQKVKQYQQKISPQSYKIQIKLFAYAGLALSGFEQPSPGASLWALAKSL